MIRLTVLFWSVVFTAPLVSLYAQEYSYPLVAHEKHIFATDITLSIAGTVGSITVVEHEENQVIVEITKQACCLDALDQVKIAIQQQENALFLVSQQPEPLTTTVQVPIINLPVLRGLFTKDLSIHTTRVDYLILIPDRAINLDLSTEYGNIGVYAGRGAVRAYSRYGECYVSD